MKILVSLHEMGFGGTTVNCVELAAALRDFHGHDVVLFASPGPLTQLAIDAGLRYLPAPLATFHPSPARMRALRAAIREEQPDLLHVWQTWPCLDAYFAAHLPLGLPMLVTDMQMHVTQVLPKDLRTTFGTPELVDRARAAGRSKVELLLPPVDMQSNDPSRVDASGFRERCGVRDGDITLVTVSRLADHQKAESLVRTVQAVRVLGRAMPRLRLLMVGDGNARGALDRLAARVNSELNRPAVVLPGALLDSRPAYATADIVVGMGSSALRAMAFGKPTIIVGERAFSATFAQATAEDFLYRGMFGVGDGDDPECTLLTTEIRNLIDAPADLPALGLFSRDFVSQHFALDVVAARLSKICADAANDKPRGLSTARDAIRTAAVYFRERRFLWRAPPAPPMESVGAMAQARR